ncbi:MAG: hypothetical protein QXS69_03290 [Candidatus Aenigmatarchaeota archaeon]
MSETDSSSTDSHTRLYIEALRDLRVALPRFSIFLFLLIFLWIIYPFLLSLGNNIFLEILDNKIELKYIINIIIITYLVVLILFTYKEIILVGSSLSKLIVFYSSNPQEDISRIEIRIKKFENTLALIFANLISFLIYYIFKDFIASISQIAAAIILILLIVSFLILFLLLSFSLSSEFETKILQQISKSRKRKNGNNKKSD